MSCDHLPFSLAEARWVVAWTATTNKGEAAALARTMLAQMGDDLGDDDRAFFEGYATGVGPHYERPNGSRRVKR